MQADTPDTMNIILIGALILFVCVLVAAVVLLIKSKKHRPVFAVIAVIAVIAIVLAGLGLSGVIFNGGRYVEDFSAFSINDMPAAYKLMDSVLREDNADIGEVEISLVNLNFANNTFERIQFTVVSTESGKRFEQDYSIDCDGRVVVDSKMQASEGDGGNALSTDEVRNLFDRLNKVDMVRETAASAPKAVAIMIETSRLTPADVADDYNAYVVQNNSAVPPSDAAAQENDECYYCRVKTDDSQMHFLFPVTNP